MKLALSEIRMDGGTQPRATLDDDRIEQYAEAYRAKEKLPPVAVVYDGSAYWLWDGFHRCCAADKAGLEALDATVTQGTQDDAVWLSLSANKDHDKGGLPRTNDDKAKAVQTAIRLRPNDSARIIAAHVGVGKTMVAEYKSQVSTADTCSRSTGRDGKSYPATKPKATRETEFIDNQTGEVLQSVTKRVVTMAEYEAEPEEPPPKRRGVGLDLAYQAIAILKQIPPNDGLRAEGFERVAIWIRDNS